MAALLWLPAMVADVKFYIFENPTQELYTTIEAAVTYKLS